MEKIIKELNNLRPTREQVRDKPAYYAFGYVDAINLAIEVVKNNAVLPLVMPRSLTAENGAKSLLNGEFFETVEIPNEEYCGCGECDYCNDFPETEETITIKVPVTWTTIKEIYAKIVAHYEA